MSHNLTSMIEEINAASTKLNSNNNRSSSSTGDPLAQIVRVLNSHLSQLQTIDEGSNALAARVEQAQKEARGLGERTGGAGGGWLDGFGRSYLGRG